MHHGYHNVSPCSQARGVTDFINHIKVRLAFWHASDFCLAVYCTILTIFPNIPQLSCCVGCSLEGDSLITRWVWLGKNQPPAGNCDCLRLWRCSLMIPNHTQPCPVQVMSHPPIPPPKKKQKFCDSCVSTVLFPLFSRKSRWCTWKI